MLTRVLFLLPSVVEHERGVALDAVILRDGLVDRGVHFAQLAVEFLDLFVRRRKRDIDMMLFLLRLSLSPTIQTLTFDKCVPKQRLI